VPVLTVTIGMDDVGVRVMVGVNVAGVVAVADMTITVALGI
jgi:hypothetical protein